MSTMFAPAFQGLRRMLAPARTIPRMPWSAQGSAWSARPMTLAILLFGLWLFGVGEAALVNSSLGNTPWTVLAQGIADHTRLDIGGATILVSVVVLAGWIPLRQRPGLGTIANVIVIGVSLDAMRLLLPHPGSVPGRTLEAAAGIVTIGVASAFYLTANLGPGPRDGWLTGIHRRLGVRAVRGQKRSHHEADVARSHEARTRAETGIRRAIEPKEDRVGERDARLPSGDRGRLGDGRRAIVHIGQDAHAPARVE